jgi:hypothetical protein
MYTTLNTLAAMAACTVFAATAFAQSARDIRGPSPLVAIENEPPPKLIVDPPLAEQLARGLVFMQYRTENLRVVPVFGKGALDVSRASAMSTSPSTMRRGTSSTPAAKR